MLTDKTCALKEALTIVCCQECGFIYIVFNIDRFPVEHCCGYDLTIGSVDGQPVCRVVQLWIPKDTQGQIEGQVSPSVSLFTSKCEFSLVCIHRLLAHTHNQKSTTAWPSHSLILHWLLFQSLQRTVNFTSFFTPVYQALKSITSLVKHCCSCPSVCCMHIF